MNALYEVQALPVFIVVVSVQTPLSSVNIFIVTYTVDRCCRSGHAWGQQILPESQ
jgi:hypothetical protein